MKEHLFARLDAAVDRVWEAVREAEEAGMQMDRVRQDLEMVPYLKESLSRAPEGMQERMVARLAARWEEFAEKVRQDALYRRQEMEKRRAAEERALQEVLAKWPEMAAFATQFVWETPFDGEGYVAGVVFHTPWGDDLRAWREGKEYEWVLQHRDGAYWEEVKDLDTVLVQKAVALARRWKAEEEERRAEEARRQAEEEERRALEAKRREEEERRKKWARATAREWLRRAANAAWEADESEAQALEAIAYALVCLLAAFVEEDEFVAPFVPVRAELEEDGQAHAVVQ